MNRTHHFICKEIETQHYEISLHADDERIAEGLTAYQIEYALLSCKIIEKYSDDPRGESCLVLGFTPEGIPIHVVCGKSPSGNLILITIYIPTMPKWKDPYTRNK
ncbi:MAG: DUF4258 domain-containing protein [Deltaproteobacteria bacterium]|nr:MAG: DUF4258 domain-containing protein [Deltaproteobacteria bacterium]